MKYALVLALVVSGLARADYMSITCGTDITEETGYKDAEYSLGNTGEWSQMAGTKTVKLKNVVDWMKGDDKKGLIATEVTKKNGYRQFFYDCKGSCWSAETAKLTVYEVGSGHGREKIDGPMKCFVSVD